MDLMQPLKKAIRIFRSQIYVLRGRQPWRYGYTDYKGKQIALALANPDLLSTFKNNQSLPLQYSQRLDERLVEFPWIITHLPSTAGRVLDAGSTINFDYILNQSVWQKQDITIMTLAPEDKSFWQKRISYVYGDLRNVPFRENWFDTITCISTLEHVGMNNDIYTADATFHEADTTSHLTVIDEFKRILKPGGKLYLTVPYGIFKLCGFQQVFNADMIQAIKTRFGGKTVQETYFRYSADGWQMASATECDQSDYFDIHVTKQYAADYAAAARAVACLILEK